MEKHHECYCLRYVLTLPIMSQKGAGGADRLGFSDEEGVNGLVSTGCFRIGMDLIIREAKKKKRDIIYVIYPTACLTVIIASIVLHWLRDLFLI